jgi:hypothetical protein
MFTFFPFSLCTHPYYASWLHLTSQILDVSYETCNKCSFDLGTDPFLGTVCFAVKSADTLFSAARFPSFFPITWTFPTHILSVSLLATLVYSLCIVSKERVRHNYVFLFRHWNVYWYSGFFYGRFELQAFRIYQRVLDFRLPPRSTLLRCPEL